MTALPDDFYSRALGDDLGDQLGLEDGEVEHCSECGAPGDRVRLIWSEGDRDFGTAEEGYRCDACAGVGRFDEG